MRPHKPTNRSRSSAAARARLLIKAKMWWLSGYPYKRRWYVLPLSGDGAAGPISIERKHLSSATRARKKLTGELRGSMQSVVGDVEAWDRGATAVVANIKDWLHRGTAPPRSLFGRGAYSESVVRKAAKLEERYPSLKKTIAALSWVAATRPDDQSGLLKWLEANGPVVDLVTRWLEPRHAIEFIIRSAVVAQDVGTAIHPLLELAANPAAHTVALHGGSSYAAAAQQTPPQVAPLPEPKLPAMLEEWARWLAARDAKSRRRFLKLLAHCNLTGLIGAWSSWWPEAETAVAAVHRAIAKSPPGHTSVASSKGVTHARDTCPSGLDLHGLSRALEWFSAPEQATLVPGLGKVLSPLSASANPVDAAGMLVHWRRLHAEGDHGQARLRAVLHELSRYLADSHDLDRALSPWSGAIRAEAAQPRYQSTVDEELLDEEMPTGGIRQSFEALALLARKSEHKDLDDPAERIVELTPLVGDAGEVAALVAALIDNGIADQWFPEPVLKAALAASARDRVHFCELLGAFERLSEGSEMQVDALYELCREHFGEHEELLRLLILDADQGAVLRFARTLAALKALGSPLGIRATRADAPSPAWISTYPPVLAPALEELSWAAADAQDIAARAFEKLARGGESIRTEAVVVRALVEEAKDQRRDHLQKRLSSLEQRMRSVDVVSPAKLERLGVRLRRRAALARVQDLQGLATRRLESKIPSLVSVAVVPPWFHSDSFMKVLAPILELPASTRKLAFRLLRVRCGSPPWDLRSAAANIRFIASMEERGLDMKPWIDGIEGVSMKRQGERYRLALEEDPLEIFLMGHHFDTCLSPRQFNFFSVFANAADINKRVIYLRSESNRIVGRQLICLNSDARIVCFNAYQHGDVAFDKQSRDFVARLAEAMGTSVAADGVVENLVAQRWYDDGIRDVAHQFEPLEEDSPFRTALGKASPSEAGELLDATRSALEPVAISLPMLLRLPELTTAPERITAFIPLLKEAGKLSGVSSIQAALLLHWASNSDLAAELFAHDVERQVRVYATRHQWTHYDALSFLARTRPSAALRMIRDTRGRGVRSWTDEASAERLVCAGIALEALHRPGQARSLYELGARAHGAMEVKRLARERAKELNRTASGNVGDSAAVPRRRR